MKNLFAKLSLSLSVLSLTACGGVDLDIVQQLLQKLTPHDHCSQEDYPAYAAPATPLCGTDGITYWAHCEVLNAGVEVAYEGECEPTEPRHECIEQDDCPAGFVCLLPAIGCEEGSDCGDIIGTCIEDFVGCTEEWFPVCGHDGVTYGNDCEANRAGAEVVHEGECEGEENPCALVDCAEGFECRPLDGPAVLGEDDEALFDHGSECVPVEQENPCNLVDCQEGFECREFAAFPFDDGHDTEELSVFAECVPLDAEGCQEDSDCGEGFVCIIDAECGVGLEEGEDIKNLHGTCLQIDGPDSSQCPAVLEPVCALLEEDMVVGFPNACEAERAGAEVISEGCEDIL